MKIRALDVSEANSYIKRILINDPILCSLKIKGEKAKKKKKEKKNKKKEKKERERINKNNKK